MNKKQRELKILLDKKVELYNRPDFIKDDPIQMAHAFTKKQDVEIMSFWTAVLAWGQRKTIINKSRLLADLMDNSPHDFICNHEEIDLIRFEDFKHRTFNGTDALYFISFFKDFYSKHKSLESAFSSHLTEQDEHVGNALIGFHSSFFSTRRCSTANEKTHSNTCSKIGMQTNQYVLALDGPKRQKRN